MPHGAPTGLFVGLTTLDFVFLVEGFPRRNTKNIVSETGLYAGGPAANAAVAFAGLGGRARLETAIGAHPLGEVMRGDLVTHRVEPLDRLPDFAALPPVASVLVSNPGGDRTAVSTASTGLPDVSFDPACFDARPDVVLIDAHLFAMCLGAARHARGLGIPVVLDGGSWKPGMDAILETVDYAVCSEHFLPPGCETPEETLADLARRGVPYRAATCGERPILWQSPEGAGEIAIEPIEAVDTLAAGDFFHGGFCHALGAGAGFEAALREGARVATLSCRSFGTRSWLAAL